MRTLGGENLEESGGEQTSISDRLERVVIVGHDDQESRGLAVHFRDEREALEDDVFEHLRFVQEALTRHGYEAPILLPRRVVNLPTAVDLFIEPGQIDVAKREPLTTQCAFGVDAVAVREL